MKKTRPEISNKRRKIAAASTAKELSLKQQGYLETIYELTESHCHAHVKAISERLNVKMASVTEAVKGLAALGLIVHEARKNIRITPAGKKIADELQSRHRVFSDFFHEILGCTTDRAENFACRIEHAIDAELHRRVAGFVDFLKSFRNKKGKNPILEFKKKYKPRPRQKAK